MKRPRKPANLSPSVRHRLNMYALSAGAAGASALALAQPSEARIIYTRIHKVIPANHHFDLDLNHDGVTDFSIRNFAVSQPAYWTQSVNALPARSGNAVQGKSCCSSTNLRPQAFALQSGVRIGPTKPFSGRILLLHSQYVRTYGWFVGHWFNRHLSSQNFTAYLGLRFKIQGKTHYGWARLTITSYAGGSSIGAKILGYAYETIPNKPIIAGKTHGPDVVTAQPEAACGSLGRLALGRK